MTNDFKLPLVGLGTCYYEFSKEDPDAGVRRHRDGRSYEEIIQKLNVSRSRVNRVVESIYAKLGVHGKARLGEFVF